MTSAPISDAALAHLRQVLDRPDLGPRYEVGAALGRGGMGAVFAARDTVLDRDVAVKVIDVDDADGQAATRLLREARILATLEHPGIIPVHDAGRLADGRVFYVMKRVRGTRLDEAAARLPDLDARLRLFDRVLDAVAFAHDRGVLHRDLTPANIMAGEFGEVLVLDWGVATSLAGEAGAGRGTSARPAHGTWSGAIVGTPGFMAPEQAKGQAGDARADVYGLGAVLTTLLPVPAPRPLAAIAARASAASPADRYASVTALQADLGRFRAGDPVAAYRERPLERAARLAARYRVPIALVLAYLVMRLALIAWAR